MKFCYNRLELGFCFGIASYGPPRVLLYLAAASLLLFFFLWKTLTAEGHHVKKGSVYFKILLPFSTSHIPFLLLREIEEVVGDGIANHEFCYIVLYLFGPAESE